MACVCFGGYFTTTEKHYCCTTIVSGTTQVHLNIETGKYRAIYLSASILGIANSNGVAKWGEYSNGLTL